jgi:hypothetical protein
VANLGDIGTAFVTVELDFDRAFEEAKRAGQNIPPVELRVDLDQSQVTREVDQKVTAAQKAAGQVDATVDLDQAQVTGAVRRTIAAASAAAGSIPVRINPASLNGAAAKIRTTLTGAFAAAGRAGSAALFPAALAIGGIGIQLKKGSDDAKTLSTSMALVRQSVKVFGKTSGITSSQIQDMSAKFEKFSSVSEESIQGAASTLQRFGVVNKKNLPDVTRLFLDTAAGMRQVNSDGEVSEAFARKFGRALQDPAKGLSLLQRGGVAVSASQRDLVKNLVKTGKTTEATAVVAGLLEAQFTGAATRLAKDIPGQLRIARDGFEDARRDIAGRIIPSIVPVIAQMGNGIADALNKNQKPIAEFVTGFVKGAGTVIKFVTTSKPFHQVISGIAAVIKGVAVGLKGFATAFATAFKGDGTKKASTFGATIKKLGEDIGKLAATTLPKLGAALGKVAGFLSEHTTTLKVLVATFVAYKAIVALGAVATAAQAAGMVVLNAAIIVVRGAVAAYTAVQWLLNAALTASPIGLVVVAIGLLVAVLVIAWKKSETFKKIVIGAWNAIKNAVVAVVVGIKNKAVEAFNSIVDFLKKWGPTILAVLTGPLGLLVLGIAKHWDEIKAKVKAVFGFVKEHIVGKFEEIKDFISNVDLSAAGRAIMNGLKDGLISGFEKVKDFILGVGKWIKDHKGPISADRRLLVDEGGAIMQGFLRGLKDKYAAVKDWVVGIGGFFKDSISPAELDISGVLLGTSKISDMTNKLKEKLQIPANIDFGVGGPAGFLHPTSGWADTLSQAHILERMFGMHMGSGLRAFDTVPGPGVSQHTTGEAVDWGDASNTNAQLNNLAAFASKLPAIFKQVIWQNSLWSGGAPTGSFVGGHLDHVHLGWQSRRAAGGGVRKGGQYQWNERGTEMFMPQQNGYVMNAGRTKELVSAIKSLAQRPSGGNSDSRVVNVHSNAADPRAVAAQVMSNMGGAFARA